MIKVFQTKFHYESNALEACIATITGIDLELVPTISECKKAAMGRGLNESEWWEIMRSWLKDMNWSTEFSRDNSAGYALGLVRSPRGGDLIHAVVLWGPKVFHDPHPDQDTPFTPEILECHQMHKIDNHLQELEDIRVLYGLPAHEEGRVSYVTDLGSTLFGTIVSANAGMIKIRRSGEKFVYPALFDPDELTYL